MTCLAAAARCASGGSHAACASRKPRRSYAALVSTCAPAVCGWYSLQCLIPARVVLQAEELSISTREAATRIFSNSSGSYSSNVNLAVENSSWSDESQLQEMYMKRKSFAFNSDRPGAGGEESRAVFEKSMSTVDMTFQNLDSSEISLTDVSHYFDSDPTNLVQGLRKDGRKPNSYVADTTTANAQVHHRCCCARSSWCST